MSKNTQISELINYISVNESGNVVFTTVPAATTNTDKFLVSDSGVLKFRTAAQLLSDIGAQASGSYQAALSGTGFVKISGSTISYDNSTYLTTSSASSTYLPLVGGTLTGALGGTSATFTSFTQASSFISDGSQFFSFTLKGRSSDNFGAFGFYSNNGATRYGYIQSGSTNGGQVVLNGDGGGTVTLDNRGMNVTGASTFSSSVTIEGTNSTIRSGNELRFNRADNAIYTRMYDAGSLAANGFTLENMNGEGFHFKNNGNTIMRMPSNGSIGIGTVNPTQKLTIDGLRGQPATTGTTQNGLFRLSTLGSGYGEALDMGFHVGVDGPASYGWIQSTNQGNLGVSYNLNLNPNGGNVGINNKTPLAKLHVTYAGSDGASVKICGVGGSTNGNFIYSLASDYSDAFPLNVFATNHGSTARVNNLVRIHSNETADGGLPLRVTAQGSMASPTYEAIAVNYLGRVGIGTISPNEKFEVNAGTGARAGIALTGEYPYLKFNTISSNANARNWVITPTWAEFGDLVIAQSTIKDGNPVTQGATAVLYFARGGDATFSGSVKSKGLVAVGASGGYTTGDNTFINLGASASADTFGAINMPFGDVMKFNSYHGFQFRTSNSTASPVTMLTIGIGGVTTFSSSVNISSTLSISSFFTANSGFAGYNTDGLFSTNARPCNVITPNGTDRIRFGYNDYGGGQYWGRIGFFGPTNWSIGHVGTEGNNLSIGTGYRGENLYLYANGNYSFTGSNVSDFRLKQNINELEINALDSLLLLTPKSYYMKANTGLIRYGFIAQEVQEVLPDLINGIEDADSYLGLDYNGITAVLVKAIQELKVENDALKDILKRNNII